MSVSGISSSGGSSSADWQNSVSRMRADFKSLSDALKSGNLADAQQAFATLQNDLPGQSGANGNSPLAQLGSALKNGDLAGAQKAFAAMQAHRGHHRHHRAEAATDDSSVATPAGTASATDSAVSTGGPGSTLNVVA